MLDVNKHLREAERALHHLELEIDNTVTTSTAWPRTLRRQNVPVPRSKN
jgi:hypothetical protein